MSNLAWIGTGECTGSEGITNFLGYSGLLVGLLVLAHIINKVSKSKQTGIVKTAIILPLIIIGAAGSVITWFVLSIATACSG